MATTVTDQTEDVEDVVVGEEEVAVVETFNNIEKLGSRTTGKKEIYLISHVLAVTNSDTMRQIVPISYLNYKKPLRRRLAIRRK